MSFREPERMEIDEIYLTHWYLGDVVVILKSVISKHMLQIKFMSTSCEMLLGECQRILYIWW